MSNSLVSVLVPAYNHEKYVQETIKSIINQTYQNIELIIIDDGSTDMTFQKICELKEKCDERFVRFDFSTKANEGVCSTLKALIKKARGNYIYMISTDDLVKPDAIETFVSFLDKNPDYGLVVGDDELIDSTGKKCYWDINRNIVYYEKEAVYKTFAQFLNQYHPYFYNKRFGSYETLYNANYIPNGFLIRKSVFDMIEPYSIEAPMEDYFLMLQLSKYSKFKYIDRVLFSYRWHDTNSVKNTTKMEQFIKQTKEYEEKILSRIDKNKVFPSVIKVRDKGALYKRLGIPYVIEIKKYKKCMNKIKILSIFNIDIYKWAKRS